MAAKEGRATCCALRNKLFVYSFADEQSNVACKALPYLLMAKSKSG